MPLPGPGPLPASASGNLVPNDIAETNRLLGSEPVTGFWRSLERLAIAEGSEEIAAKIREAGVGL